MDGDEEAGNDKGFHSSGGSVCGEGLAHLTGKLISRESCIGLGDARGNVLKHFQEFEKMK